MRHIIIAAVLAHASAASSQTIYKCEGPNGETQFSQRPCSDDAEIVDVGPTNSGAPPSKAASDVYKKRDRARRQERYERNVQRIDNDYRSSPNYVCQGARDNVESAKERWQAIKRQGYTPDEQRYYEQLIIDRQRHADNVCR